MSTECPLTILSPSTVETSDASTIPSLPPRIIIREIETPKKSYRSSSWGREYCINYVALTMVVSTTAIQQVVSWDFVVSQQTVILHVVVDTLLAIPLPASHATYRYHIDDGLTMHDRVMLPVWLTAARSGDKRYRSKKRVGVALGVGANHRRRYMLTPIWIFQVALYPLHIRTKGNNTDTFVILYR